MKTFLHEDVPSLPMDMDKIKLYEVMDEIVTRWEIGEITLNEMTDLLEEVLIAYKYKRNAE